MGALLIEGSKSRRKLHAGRGEVYLPRVPTITAPNTVLVVLGTTIHEFASNDRISPVETRGWSD
jgi:hypothetical protein